MQAAALSCCQVVVSISPTHRDVDAWLASGSDGAGSCTSLPTTPWLFQHCLSQLQMQGEHHLGVEICFISHIYRRGEGRNTGHTPIDSIRIVYAVCNIFGERAKRARHSQVCSIENRIYIIIYILWYVQNFVLITRKEGGA